MSRGSSWADIVTGRRDENEGPNEEEQAPSARYTQDDSTEGYAEDFGVEEALAEAGGSIHRAAQQLWKLDGANRLRPGIDYEVNTQLKARSYHDDEATDPFVTFLSEEVWERPTYASFRRLLDNYVAETGVPERVSDQEREEEQTFLDAICETPVIRFVQKWLAEYAQDMDVGMDVLSMSSFRDVLYRLWFALYARGIDRDSSGFEHAFCGEIDRGVVKGMHNFFQVYLEEQRGHFNYMGYLEYGQRRGEVDGEDRLLTVRFKWMDRLKPASSMFVGCSPEFEIALYTLMWLGRAAGQTVELGPYDVRVKVYDMHGFIGAAFPELVGVDYDEAEE